MLPPPTVLSLASSGQKQLVSAAQLIVGWPLPRLQLPSMDNPVEAVATIHSEWQKAELAVDGPTLNFVLADDAMRHKLAVLSAHCSGVVVSRSSPSQKAAIVRMMTKYEMWKAAGSTRGLRRWYAMHRRRLQVSFRGGLG